MSEVRMSPAYRSGMIHGAYQAAMPARYRAGYCADPVGWQYRRGFARGFRAARGLPPLERKHAPQGRCWCRAYHVRAEPLDAIFRPGGFDGPVDPVDVTNKPGPKARPAPEPVELSPLERARRANHGA